MHAFLDDFGSLNWEITFYWMREFTGNPSIRGYLVNSILFTKYYLLEIHVKLINTIYTMELPLETRMYGEWIKFPALLLNIYCTVFNENLLYLMWFITVEFPS